MRSSFLKSGQNHSKGQSLIEAIVGIGILVAGLITTLAVGITTIRAGQIAKSRTIADNLAREGLEVVRNIRDSNWLYQNSINPANQIRWDDQLCETDDDHTAFPSLSDDFNWTLDYSLDDLTEAPAIIYQINDTTLHQTYYRQPSRADATVTVFRRILEITPRNQAGAEIAGCTSEEPTSYRVASTVQWTERGTTHQTELEEEIYNWRP